MSRLRSGEAVSSLLDHWRLLRNSVHPLDAGVFEGRTHTFNLDFPPPAFIGDLENAPVILLEANGGYDPIITPSEFPDRRAIDRYLGMLHDPQPIEPSTVAPYYGKRNYARHIARGLLVLVNAVAYRSAGISREPLNRAVAEELPSTAVHRNWLRTEVLPTALGGDRLVIAHRNGLWKLKRDELDSPYVRFSANARSPDLSREALSAIADFTRTR
jgi:hypothetical protein